MDTNKRRQIIENLVREKKEIDIGELNKMFEVSKVSVRNDLVYLEKKGAITRRFGKVSLPEKQSFCLGDDTITNLKEKEAIGKLAASLIKAGDSVLFYAGTTTQQIVKFINDELKFVAVTNSINIANALRAFPNASIVMIGGKIQHQNGVVYGLQAINQIKEYNIDKLFLSVDGIDADAGITNSQPFESDINDVIIEHSKYIAVVADHTKIGNVSFIKMGSIDKVDLIITDSKATEEQLKPFEGKTEIMIAE